MYKYANSIFHDSCKAAYRQPLGAQPAGSKIVIKLYTGKQRVTGAAINFFIAHEQHTIAMDGADGWWRGEVTLPSEPILCWYNFSVYFEDGMVFYGARAGMSSGLGEIYSNNPLSYQITVYDPSFKTPDYCKEAIMYQVFPDRFARSDAYDTKKGIAYHESMKRTPYLHESFSGTPFYLPRDGKKEYYPDDFYGGNLKGIEEKLDYIAGLGVNILYLNPICEADSNHRYNTSDYKKVDPILGTEQHFKELCAAAEERGIRVILDGVYSHTGADSKYFNALGTYKGKGACESKNSPYYSWFDFKHFPDEYRCWWGFTSLPEVNEHDPSWQDYVITGKDSVLKFWMDRGAAGYRLDVADELPDDVIEKMRDVIKKKDPESFLLGEVWEDATNKESYGAARKYALGRGLDSVMNYPLRNAIVDFLRGRATAKELAEAIRTQASNYPKEMYYCLMNLLSSHDIARIRTVLASNMDIDEMDRNMQAAFRVTYSQDTAGRMLQFLAAAIIYSLPGIPSIYYGDETGMHGLKDPFNRAPFAMNDARTAGQYAKLGKIRREHTALSKGYMAVHAHDDDVLAILRVGDAFGGKNDGVYLTVVNNAQVHKHIVLDLRTLAEYMESAAVRTIFEKRICKGECMLTGERIRIEDDLCDLFLLPGTAYMFELI